MTTGYITLEASKAASWAAMTPAEQADYKIAYAQAGLRMRLAELVLGARTEAGLSQRALAHRAGTNPAAISAVERGARVPGGLMLERVANALGLDLACLFDDATPDPGPAAEAQAAAG